MHFVLGGVENKRKRTEQVVPDAEMLAGDDENQAEAGETVSFLFI